MRIPLKTLTQSSIMSKFIVPTASIILGAVGACVWLLSNYTSEQIKGSTAELVHARSQQALDVLTSTHSLMKQRVDVAMKTLRSEGDRVGPPSLGPTTSIGAERIPALSLGGANQVNATALVDRVSGITGSTATLFVRRGDDYVRVSTNVMKPDGSRAVGTMLDPKGKAIVAIRDGRSFAGVVEILGEPYFTSYEPMRDRNGEVVGIWYVGYPISTLIELGKTIEHTRILQGGFMALIDAKDKARFHTEGVPAETVQKLAVGDEALAAGWVVEHTDFDPWGYSVVVGYPRADVDAVISTARMNIILAGVVIGALICGLIAVLVLRMIVRPVGVMVKAAGSLAQGDISISIPEMGKDEIGALSRSFRDILDASRERAEAARRISEGDLSITVTPRTDHDVLGRSLQQAIVALQGLVGETTVLSQAAVDGKLATRGNADQFQGGYREIVRGVNATLDAVIGPLNVAAEYVDRISKGEIPARITDTYNGDFNAIRDNLNQAIDAVHALVTDARMLSEAAVAGRFETRADVSAHSGDFRKIVEGVNATLDTVVDKIFWYEALLDSIPMPISVTDAGMQWTFINRPVEQLLGVKRKDILGKHCSNWNATICNTEECGVAGLRRKKLQTVFAQAGMDFQVDTSYILNRNGEQVGHIEVIQDITARQRAGEYQRVEVERLAANLQKLSQGDLAFDLGLGEADQYTRAVRENFVLIAENLVRVQTAIRALVDDSVLLARAAVDGRLSTRADAAKHHGDFRKIVQGVNDTLDAVIKPVQEGSQTLAVMATGDLTVRMQGAYQGDLQLIKESINKVGISLHDALQNVSEVIRATAAASGQISSSTEQMAAGAQEQTSQAGEVATAVEEMTKTIMENSRNANVAAETAKQARVSAEHGGEVVGETVDGMKRIAGVVNRSAETVRELGRSSDQIGEIIGVIDDIADQTNLLALNAAIEAARAGDQGRGFAVVADEVRKLAERTTKATKEIAGMIKKIQSDTAGAVQSMEEGTSEVERGIQLADKAGASLQEIVGVSQKVTDMVTQIAAASEEQSSASEQISKNVEAISKVTGETAQGTQQIARAAEELNRLTEDLQKLIGDFRLGQATAAARSGVAVRSNGALVAG